MDRDTALELFSAIEAHRSETAGHLTPTPTYNVRLDAGTTNGSDERFYRLFVRIDDALSWERRSAALSELANWVGSYALSSSIENSGIELS